MTDLGRGDVLLVGFVFSEETGMKMRPALVISSGEFHRRRQEVIVAAITSNVRRRLFGDHLVVDWKDAGLLFPSLVTAILRTIKRTMIVRKIGTMPKRDLAAIDGNLHRTLSL